MNEADFVKRIYEGRIQGYGIRGKPSGKGSNREDRYWREKKLADE